MIKKIKFLINTEEKKRLLSNFFSLAILQGANYILPLITFPYLVRVLGVEKFGIVMLAIAVISYLNILVDYGFNLTATKEISIYREDKKKLNEIFNNVIFAKFFLLIVSFFLLLGIIKFFNISSLLFLFSFGIVIGKALFPQWFFQGMEEMKYISYINVSSKIFFMLLIFVFVKKESDYLYVPLLNGLGFIVSGVIALWIVVKKYNFIFYFSFEKVLVYLKDGFIVFLANLGSNFHRNFNVILLGFFVNSTLLGYYAIAERVIRIIQTLQSVIGSVLYPYFVRKISLNRNYFFEFTRKYIGYIIGGYLILSLLLFIFAPYILEILNANGGEIDLKILSFVIIIGGLNYYFGLIGLMSMGYQKEYSKFIITAGIFNAIISLILIYFYKDIGASLGLVFSELILLFLFLNFIRKLYANRFNCS